MKIFIVYRENDFLQPVVAMLIEQLKCNHEVAVISFPLGTTAKDIKERFTRDLDEFRGSFVFSDDTCFSLLGDVANKYTLKTHGLPEHWNPYHHDGARETLNMFFAIERAIVFENLLIPSFLGAMDIDGKELKRLGTQVVEMGKRRYTDEEALNFLESTIKPIYRKLLRPAIRVGKAVLVSERIGDHPPFRVLSGGTWVKNSLRWPQERTAQYLAGWLSHFGLQTEVVENFPDLSHVHLTAIQNRSLLFFADHHVDVDQLKDFRIGTCLCHLGTVATLFWYQTKEPVSRAMQQELVKLAVHGMKDALSTYYLD
ncbi:MAG: hypothetical protein Q8R25_03725 [bacterium]|nr:hypothetical protein [bacterium]